MANPREHIRAAQAAELRGDKEGAISELRKAARIYQRVGSPVRALQLLRHASKLDPSRADLAEELGRLEAPAEAGSAPSAAIESASQRAYEWALAQEPAPEEPAREEPAREEPGAEPTLIERGPTRADPALEAWCSFCCRPRAEVGELVAGPAGAFICAACVGESRALLGLNDSATAPPARPVRREGATAGGFELVGQQEARALLERGLEAGARRLLVVGPEGSGKSAWFQALARQERGVLATLEALEQGAGGRVALVEDVDRLAPEAQARLGALLTRHPERTVLMSARGSLEAPSLVLRGAAGSLPVRTTGALSQAVRGALPVALLEQVQLAIPLQVPTQGEFLEIARQRLAPRAPGSSLSEEVLAAFAAEAARSPRAGHELSALLARVPAGSWSLDTGGRSAGGRPGPRGRRKGAR